LTLGSEAPLRSGLGGSSTLAVALVRGMSRLFRDYFEQGGQWRMLDWVKDAEAAYIKTPTGTQDYLAAMFGGLNCFVTELGAHRQEAYPESVFNELCDHLLVLFSGEMHNSGLSNWEIYKGAFEGNKETLSGLKAISDLSQQLDGELRSGRLAWKHIGQLLSEEWKVRRATFHVETPRLDQMVSFLQGQKVLGTKVCGAAQGGSLIALIEPGRRKEITEACRDKGLQVLHTTGTRRGVTLLPLS